MGDTLRVTIVGSGAGIGGTERHIAALVAGLRHRGFEVELVTSEKGPLGAEARANGAAWTVVLRPGPVRYCLALALHLRRTRPDVVHAHAGRLACVAARLAGVPWIVDTRHGHLDPGLWCDEAMAGWMVRWRTAWRWRAEGLKGRFAHFTLTVCQADAAVLIRRGGLPKERVRAVYNGLGHRERSPVAAVVDEHAPNVIGWVGRMAEQKAPERALHLLHELVHASDLPDPVRDRLRLVFVGDGPLRSALDGEAVTLGIRNRVEFRGPLSDPLPALREFRLLLLPSRREGLPYVLLESLAVGTPVLATPVGGNAEVLHGDLGGGLLAWDRAAWAREAARLLLDETAWSKVSVEGLRQVRAFDEARMVEAIAEAYRREPARRPSA